MSFELPSLPYEYGALEPHIDTQTMQIHHDKHHAAYVTNLNKALESAAGLAGKPITEILADLSAVPENVRQAVINNGGGHYNHTHVLGDHGAQRRRRAEGRSGQGHRRRVWQLRRSAREDEQRRSDPLRFRLGVAGGQTKKASCKYSAQPIKTARCPAALSRSWASTCGNTPIT